MPLNYSTLVYLPNYDYFARPITVTPSGGGGASSGRGIFDTDELDVVLEDGSIFSDQRTVLYLRESEWSVLPKQHDRIVVGAVDDIPGEGEFEVRDVSSNGGGETKLTLRKWETARPPILPPEPAQGSMSRVLASLRLFASGSVS